MHSIDKTPFWAWPLGIVGCSGPVIAYLIVHEVYVAAALVGAAILYGAGLGRALLRRRLVAQGLPLDDRSTRTVPPRYEITTISGHTVWVVPKIDPESGLDWIELRQKCGDEVLVAMVGPGDFYPAHESAPADEPPAVH
ncbi:hypothetical protein ACFQZ4_51010 [Catellatospora coxensis]|uniref:Uncharacterized protein n=1 Tax=Catellatospora coxensis TaxID=310354 RepID=A0A8J3LBC9_9ACTN|nr:hypothetical protein [Catellatospora coxensis]GIG11500.1 hypothetical protein Cco03nite_82000 [Catellatospora coxensis]